MASRVDGTAPTGIYDRLIGCLVGRAVPAGGHVIGGISEYAFVDAGPTGVYLIRCFIGRAIPTGGHVDGGISDYGLVYRWQLR